MGGTPSIPSPPAGMKPCRKVEGGSAIPDVDTYYIDSAMMYNFIQYVDLWGGWMVIYDLRGKSEYQNGHIANAVWGWDGSDLPGEFKARLFDETSFVVVVMYDDAGGSTKSCKSFLSTLKQGGATPTVLYILEEPLETFKRTFPFMMSDYKDRLCVRLPGPYLPIMGDKQYPSVFALDEKLLVNVQGWMFQILNITKVINMGALPFVPSKKGRSADNFVDFAMNDLPKIYKVLKRQYLDLKRKGNILIIDREGFDFATQLCGWLLLDRTGVSLALEDVKEYLGRCRPDMEDRYLDDIADIDALEEAEQPTATTLKVEKPPATAVSNMGPRQHPKEDGGRKKKSGATLEPGSSKQSSSKSPKAKSGA